MNSIVLELQAEATGSGTATADLLRKTLVVAAKLKLPELQEWARKELNGYASGDAVPAYRKIRGDLRAQNPYNGSNMPVRLGAETTDLISNVEVKQSIGSLEAAISESRQSGHLQMTVSEEVAIGIRQLTNVEWLVPFLSVSESQIAAIFDAVRNQILEWALRLESEGVLGNGHTFSSQEQQKAVASMQSFNIQTFNGVIGNVADSTVTVTDYSTVHGQLKALGIGQAERNELESIMDEYKSAPAEKKPGLVARAVEWIDRNKATIGVLVTGLRHFFGLP